MKLEKAVKCRKPVDDMLHGLREVVRALKQGIPLKERFVCRTVPIAECKNTADIARKPQW